MISLFIYQLFLLLAYLAASRMCWFEKDGNTQKKTFCVVDSVFCARIARVFRHTYRVCASSVLGTR